MTKKAYNISLELEEAIFDSLVRYWIQQGVPRDHAELAARKALERLRLQGDDGTWCLLPKI